MLEECTLAESRRMANVKQEDVDESTVCGDQWLLESIEMEEGEESKPDFIAVKSESKHEISEHMEIEADSQANGANQDIELGARLLNGQEAALKHEKDTGAVHSKNACEQVQVSEEVSNLCEYKCPKCHKIYNYRGYFTKHLNTSKHVVVSRTNLSNYMVSRVMYRCKICSKEVLCDKGEIYKHAYHIHKIKTMKEYIDMKSEKMILFQKKWLEKEKNKQNKWGDIDSAPISIEIGNLCTYKCQVCKATFVSRTGFARHLKINGHGQASETLINKSLDKAVIHKCSICSDKILCDRTIVTYHIRKHKINSLKTYMEMTNVKQKSMSHVSQMIRDQLYKEYATENNVTRHVKNLCKFMCTKCDYVSRTWNKTQVHISSKGHGPLLAVTDYLKKITLHKCHICDKLVLCDKTIISKHISSKHNLLRSSYYKIAMEQCPDVTEDLHELYRKKLQLLIRNIPVVNARHHVLEKGSLPADQITKHVGNCSKFQCSFCNMQKSSYHTLLTHCKAKHNSKHLTYDKEYVVEARYHQCHICSDLVLCDNYFVQRHLKKSHKMKISNYTKEFVLKNGSIVFPTFPDFLCNNDVFENLDRDIATKGAGGALANEISNDVNGLILPEMISSESEDSDEG